MTSAIFRKRDTTFLVTHVKGGKHDSIIIQRYMPLEKAYYEEYLFKIIKFDKEVKDIRKELEKYLNLYLKTVCP